MQRIMSEEEKARKERRNQMAVGIVLVAILILSTAGYALFSGERTSSIKQEIEYGGLKFSLAENGFWQFNIQEYGFYTTYNPKETENISGFISLRLQDYSNKPVYFEEGSDVSGITEISRNFERFFSRLQYACLGNCSEDLPVKNCSDNVISIKQGETLIKQENNCVYILSNETLRASDAFIFKVLGIQN